MEALELLVALLAIVGIGVLFSILDEAERRRIQAEREAIRRAADEVEPPDLTQYGISGPEEE